MSSRVAQLIDYLFAPMFQMLRGVPPRAMMRLLTPF